MGRAVLDERRSAGTILCSERILETQAGRVAPEGNSLVFDQRWGVVSLLFDVLLQLDIADFAYVQHPLGVLVRMVPQDSEKPRGKSQLTGLGKAASRVENSTKEGTVALNILAIRFSRAHAQTATAMII